MKTVFTRGLLLLWLFTFLGFHLIFPNALPSHPQSSKASLRFGSSFSKERSQQSLDGRMLLMVSADSTQEPRFQISDDADTQLIFGIMSMD